MTRWLLPLIAFPLLAAPLLAASPPQRQLTLAVPQGRDPLQPLMSGTQSAGPVYTPAPTPNRDIDAPRARASNAPSVSPSLFTRKDQFRGDGFTGGVASTAQTEQERRVTPGAGLSLHMPLVGQ